MKDKTNCMNMFEIWNKAKSFAKNMQFEESIKLYYEVEVYFLTLNEHATNKSTEKNMFYQTMFFADYCGVLCSNGHYEDAKEKGNIALKYMEMGNFTTLKYVYYNIGNIYLFQKEYKEACKWYKLSLEGAKYFYTDTNDYLVNYGISLYFLGMLDIAKEKFELAIKEGKGTKYNKNFEPFFYMMKICELQGEEKVMKKYKKMYLTRLKKYSKKELQFIIFSLQDQYKVEIEKDYVFMMEQK